MATDLSTSLLSSISASNYKAQVDALITQYKTSLSKPVQNLNTKKTTLTNLKQIYSTLTTKIETLNNLAKDFSVTDSTSKFNISSVSTTNSSIITGTASGNPEVGSHSILVTQLAKSDKAISSKLTKDSIGLVSEGVYSFRISINDTDYDVNVDVSQNDSNSTILQKIADAVNSSDAKDKISASVLSISSNIARLVLSSKETGSDNAFNLSDISGDLLQKIEIIGSGNNNDSVQENTNSESSRIQAQGDKGGYIFKDINNLDANFKIDGTEIIRSSNTIKDVISGVTLNLKGVQKLSDEEVNLTIALDNTKIQSNIESFITAYNDVLTYLNQKLASKDGNRAELAGDTILMGLKYNLRQIILSKVTSVSEGNPGFLADIGIIINRDGTLQLKDTKKFNSFLDSNVSNISDLFNSTNGIAIKLKNLLTPIVSTNGLLDKRSSSTSQQITSTDSRIKNLQVQIDKKAEVMRTQYENLITVMNELSQQQILMQSLLDSYISFNDSLY